MNAYTLVADFILFRRLVELALNTTCILLAHIVTTVGSMGVRVRSMGVCVGSMGCFGYQHVSTTQKSCVSKVIHFYNVI